MAVGKEMRRQGSDEPEAHGQPAALQQAGFDQVKRVLIYNMIAGLFF